MPPDSDSLFPTATCKNSNQTFSSFIVKPIFKRLLKRPLELISTSRQLLHRLHDMLNRISRLKAAIEYALAFPSAAERCFFILHSSFIKLPEVPALHNLPQKFPICLFVRLTYHPRQIIIFLCLSCCLLIETKPILLNQPSPH